MNDKDGHHVIKASNQLLHNHLYDLRADAVLFVFHDFLEIASIAELHKNVVPCLSFDGFRHLDDILRLDSILVLYLTNYQVLPNPGQLLPLNNLAGVVLLPIVRGGKGLRLVLCDLITV